MFAHLRGRDKDDGSAGDGEASAAEERIASVDEDAGKFFFFCFFRFSDCFSE